MTTYNRRGHYRRGPNGQRVWVSSHSVTRTGGQTYSPRSLRYVPGSYAQPQPTYQTRSTPTIRLPRSTGLVRPNAVCPVCGAYVYFYSNDFGSRVYFDEVGPPWPKHPCTDNAKRTSSFDLVIHNRRAPALYPAATGRRKLVSEQVPASVVNKAFTVLGFRQHETGTTLRLQPLYQRFGEEAWVTPLYIAPPVGQLVFVHDNVLSYMDEERIEVVQLPIRLERLLPKESFLERLRKRWS